MKIIAPTTIEDVNLIDSSIDEDDYPEWVAGTYNTGDKVIVVALHKIFESVSDGNTDDPSVNASDPPKWIELGWTNRFAMFRDPIEDYSHADDLIEIEVAPGRVTGMSFFGLQGTVLEIEGYDGAELLFNRQISLIETINVFDWYSYFYEPVLAKRDVVVVDMPNMPAAATYIIRIVAQDGEARCGRVILGVQYDLGITLAGARFSIIDYSRKTRDEFGRSVIVQRNFSKRVEATVVVEGSRTEMFYRLMGIYRTEPIVWVFAKDFQTELTLVYGYYRDFSVIIPYPSYSSCLLEVESLL